jgi:hypothetical protein
MAVTKKKRRGRHGRKSEAIREAIAAIEASGGNATNKEVVEHLKSRRIKVSTTLVSNVRARSGAKTKTTRGAGGALSVDLLIAAKKMAVQLGGVERAKQALDILARLQ